MSFYGASHHANNHAVSCNVLVRVQVKRRLENLDSIGVVTVEQNSTLPYGVHEWTVTFETEVGDLPMLGVTTGRLTGGGSSAAVTEKQAGSAATLIFDGSGMPSVKIFTATGLVEDALYAFKVRHIVYVSVDSAIVPKTECYGAKHVETIRISSISPTHILSSACSCQAPVSYLEVLHTSQHLKYFGLNPSQTGVVAIEPALSAVTNVLFPSLVNSFIIPVQHRLNSGGSSQRCRRRHSERSESDSGGKRGRCSSADRC